MFKLLKTFMLSLPKHLARIVELQTQRRARCSGKLSMTFFFGFLYAALQRLLVVHG